MSSVSAGGAAAAVCAKRRATRILPRGISGNQVGSNFLITP